MKRCPECRRDYHDDTLLYCLDDGNALLEGPASMDEPATAILHSTDIPGEASTHAQIHMTDQTAGLPANTGEIVPKARGFDKRLIAAPLFAVIISFGVYFGYQYLGYNNKQIESIAVMPFVNESGNADIEYLSDGMTETLINSLSQLPNLNVKPRSSVFRYKGKETNSQTIGKELNVQAILNGRVVQRGQDISLFIELIDISLDKVIWSETYNRKQSDLIVLQSDIARDVSNKLKTKLSSADEAKVLRTYTANAQAYELYLKGRYYWNKRTLENIRKSIEQFKAAVDKDPNYALAYVGLADSYVVLPFYGIPSEEVLPQAQNYAQRALEIDDSLSETQTSMAFINTNLWNWSEAEKGYKRAIELNPNYSHAHKWYGDHLGNLGRVEESLKEHKRAQELEPMSLIVVLNVAERYLALGDLNAALEQSQLVVDLDPNWYFVKQLRGLIFLKQGRKAEAISEAEKSVELSYRQSWTLGVLGYIYAETGNQSKAEAILRELEEKYAKRQAMGHDISRVYVGLGDKEQAFAWLEKDFLSRNSTMSFWLYQAPLNSLRTDPRFKDLVKRMGMPE
ncbi:MAG: hypothetical protein ABIV48_07545 [Pyrinomonadaceae bacterium]